MPALIVHVGQLLGATKYPLFFLGSFFDGTFVMLAGGVLLRFGEVAALPVYVALLAGDILSDITWYFIGYFGARPFIMRWGHVVNATPAVVEKLEQRFNTYHTRILVISKLTMGFGIAAAVLMTAGMMRVSFLRYCVINIAGGFVWVAFVVFVGYNFGNVLAVIPGQYQIAFVLILLTGFFFGLRYINGRLAKANW